MASSALDPIQLAPPTPPDIQQLQSWVTARIDEWQRVYQAAQPWIDKATRDNVKFTQDVAAQFGGNDFSLMYSDLKSATYVLEKVIGGTNWIIDPNGLQSWDDGLKSLYAKLDELTAARYENQALRAQVLQLQTQLQNVLPGNPPGIQNQVALPGTTQTLPGPAPTPTPPPTTKPPTPTPGPVQNTTVVPPAAPGLSIGAILAAVTGLAVVGGGIWYVYQQQQKRMPSTVAHESRKQSMPSRKALSAKKY